MSVDGEPGTALGTMSQGEINALALSVFLPRAAMPGSPFGFLVIDDPVQAMDLAKVDGLARVLAKVAADRQVIVFTHDNRLAAAVRDLCIPATILEVTRTAAEAAFAAGPQVITDIRNRWGSRFGDTMNALNRGSHQGHQGNLDLLIGDTRKLVAEIETRLP